MAKKYEVVELDGIFGLVMDENVAVQQSGLNKYPIQYNETTGQIGRMKQTGRSMYDNYFVTRGNITFDGSGVYEPRGITHYMGHRMSLDQLSFETGATFVRLSEKFSSKYSEDVSNFNGRSKPRFGHLLQTVIYGLKKVDEFSDRMQQQQIDALDTQLPGFKASLEQAAQKAHSLADRMEGRLAERLEKADEGQQQSSPAKKPALDFVIKSSASRTATQQHTPTRGAEKAASRPNVPANGLGR